MGNKKLIGWILVLGLIVSARLCLAAVEQENLRGLAISLAHLVVVGMGSYYALKQPLKVSKQIE